MFRLLLLVAVVAVVVELQGLVKAMVVVAVLVEVFMKPLFQRAFLVVRLR
jgi:hypothetical protein